MEDQVGVSMVNLAEPLLLSESVSYGLNSRSVSGTTVNAVVMGSRLDNFNGYDDAYEVSKALYDQILVSPALFSAADKPQMQLLLSPAATRGNEDTRSSDHIPVFIDLFKSETMQGSVLIDSVLPNPAGSDNNNELIVVRSSLSLARSAYG